MDEQLRIGDAEREQAAAALGEHFVQGRLTADEHAERLDRVWTARTRSDLAAIFRDLPTAGAAGSTQSRRTPAPAARAVSRRGSCGGFRRAPFVPFPLAIAALVLLTIATPLTPPVAALIAFALLVLGPRRRWQGRRWTGPGV